MAADEDLLREIRDRFRFANREWTDIRDEGDVDMRFVAGDPWEPKDRRAREDANRPCLSEDELNQYFNQVINNVRQNPRAIKFTPQGNGANDQTAEFYANKARETEYRSHAQLAYITAFENAVQRSFGWVRLVTKFAQETVLQADPAALDSEIWIDAVHNPNMVVPDPHAKRPDSSDMQYLYFLEMFERAEFKRKWPKASITNFSQEFITRSGAEDWFKGGSVQVAEYWTKVVSGSKRLLLLKPGPPSRLDPNPVPLAVFANDLKTLPSSDQILRERRIDTYKVTQYLTNGVEILDQTDWPGKYIPFASCLGKVIYVDDGTGAKRNILSLTRLARSPQMLYAYYCTTEAEIVGAIPKFPYFYYEGQISPENLELLAKSVSEPVVGIPVKATIPGMPPGQPLPHPQRTPWDPPIQGIQLGKESARRAIQAAMGVTPLPTAAQRRNEKSGVALEQIEKTEQVGSFHFSAHYDDMVRHVGVMFEDLCDKVYDTARDTAIRKADDSSAIVRINDPGMQPRPDQQQPISTKGDHAVTVSSGPAADSQREAVSDFVGTLSQIPEVMQLCGDLIVRLQSKTMNLGPLMEELADRLTPPQFKKPANGQQPDPQQLMQQVQQLTQTNQQSQDAIAKLTMEIKTKVAEYQQQAQIDAMKLDKQAQLQIALKHMDLAAKIEVARITAAKQTADLVAEGQEEALALGLEHAHEATQNALDRAHEKALAVFGHAATVQQQDQGHQQALELGAQPPPVDPNAAPPDQPGAGA